MTRLDLHRLRRLAEVARVLRGECGLLPDPEFQEALEAIAEGSLLLVKELEDARRLLRRYEWTQEVTGVYHAGCPECLRTRREGHAEDCALALLLG